MPKHTFGEIPDDFITKWFLPLNPRLYEIFQELGWDHVISKFDEVASKFTFDTLKYRMNSAIQVAMDVISGKIKNPEKTLGYTLFPPGGFMRSDLQQGSMKLLYGESIDVSYVAVRDDTQEILLILNGHLEDGIPTDWFMISQDDEIMQRRHLKTGIRLIDLFKKNKKKSFSSVGAAIREILLDIRNERNPQWANSAYQIGIGWGSFGAYIATYLSYYEQMGITYDLMAAKRVYGLPDVGFTYIPTPPIIGMIAFLERAMYIKRMVGLSTELKMAINGMSEFETGLLKEAFPEEYEMLVPGQWNSGVPYPLHTLTGLMPDIKKMLKKKNFNEDNLEIKYDESLGKFIHLEDLGLPLGKAMNCVYLDIDNNTIPNSVDLKEKIISIGIGYDTKFVK